VIARCSHCRQMSEHGISNFAVNTIVTALHAQQWNVLLHMIGRPTMIHLLTKAYVFTTLPNGCLCQMTGKPVYSLPKTRDTSGSSRIESYHS
ncbi:hypothetical protein MPER_16139, partial [Moniliophthora perniciosa FA553]